MLYTDVLKQFFGAYQFKVVKDFTDSGFFQYADAFDPKRDFFIGRKGEGKGPPVQVDQAVHRKSAPDFLYVSFWKHYIVVFLKHLLLPPNYSLLTPFYAIPRKITHVFGKIRFH
jgi:hypothetical protein